MFHIKSLLKYKLIYRICYRVIWSLAYRREISYRGQTIEITRSGIIKSIRWRWEHQRLARSDLYGDRHESQKFSAQQEEMMIQQAKNTIDEVLKKTNI